MMQFLKFVNICIFAAFSLNGVSQTANNKLLVTSNEVFMTSIDLYGHSVDGLTVFEAKDSATVRILFTTVGGPKLLDLEITPKGYRTIYAIKKLDRKVVLKALQEDFALLSGLYLALPDHNAENNPMEKQMTVAKNKMAAYSFKDTLKADKAKMMGKKKMLFDVEYLYDNDSLEQIVLTHYNFNMKITLNRIKETLAE